MAVGRMIARKAETKYRAWDLNTNGYIPGILNGNVGGTWHYLLPVIPPVYQGTGSHQRVGNSITPLKLKVTVEYFFHKNGTSDHIPASQTEVGIEPARIFKVKQYVVNNRRIRSCSGWIDTNNTIKSEEIAKLLDAGDGTTSYADSGMANVLDYPVYKESFTTQKGNGKTFLMCKNNGISGGTGAGGQPFTSAVPYKKCVFYPKLPKTFKYEDVGINQNPAGDHYPSNFNCLWGAVAGFIEPQNPLSVTNGPCLTYEQVMAQTTLVTPAYPYQPMIRYNCRLELWFKDE